MANELIHASAGTTLTQAEFEAVGLHVCNSQATGDLIYASSITQLSRLGITNDRILISSGGVPTWSNTMPAFTLGGAVAGGGIDIGSVASPCGTFRGNTLANPSVNSPLYFSSLLTAANTGVAFAFYSYNASDASALRLAISGGVATAVATWSAITHTGVQLTGAANAFGAYVLATGTGKTVDNVITALQALGLVTQA